MEYIKCLVVLLIITTQVNAQRVIDTGNYKRKEMKNRKELRCNLTTPELRKRKTTIIANIKKQIVEKKELMNGVAYKFSGSDKTVDELISFIKTERLCCNFFVFDLSIHGDASEAWLKITGPKGVKDFIKTELGM